MKCPECNQEIREGLKFCPNCGGETDTLPGPDKPVFKTRKDLTSIKTNLKTGWKPFLGIIFTAALLYGGITLYTAYKIEADFRYGMHQNRIGEYGRAVEKLESVVDKRPRMTKAWIELAVGYRELNKKELAITTLKKALKWNLRNPDIYALLGQLYFMDKKYADARKSLLKAVGLDPKNRLANQYLGYDAFRDRKYGEAEKYLKKALDGANRTDRITINKMLGDVHFKQKKFKEAEAAYRACLADDINNIDASAALIDTFLELGKYSKAKRELDRLIQIAPENKEMAKRKERIEALIERVETIKYIKSRKTYDDAFMMIYSSMQGFISRMNRNREAFVGKDLPEMAQMIDDADGLFSSYTKLRPPGAYYHVHTVSMTNASFLSDTVKALDKYVKSGEIENFRELASTLKQLSQRVDAMLQLWTREEKLYNINAMIEEAKKFEAGKISVMDLKTPATKDKSTPERATSTATPPAPHK